MAKGKDEAAWERSSAMTTSLINVQLHKKDRIDFDTLNKYKKTKKEVELTFDDLERDYKRLSGD